MLTVPTIRCLRNAACGVRWASVAIMLFACNSAHAGFVAVGADTVANLKSACELPFGLDFICDLPSGMTASTASHTSTSTTATHKESRTEIPPIGDEQQTPPFGIAVNGGGTQSSSSPGAAGSSVSSVPLLSVMGMLPADKLVSCLAAEPSALLPPNLPFKLFRPPKFTCNVTEL